MRSIEMTGKTVDIAIFNGLQQLGLSIDEVTIEILQTETKGILGFGSKPAKVRLTEKPQEEVVIPDFESERNQRERKERRKDDFRNNRSRERGEEHRDEMRDRRKEQSSTGKKAVQSAEDKDEQGSKNEPVRRRPEKKKPYKNVDEMLAAMGSSVDTEVEESFTADESIGEATSLSRESSNSFGIRYNSDFITPTAASTASAAASATPTAPTTAATPASKIELSVPPMSDEDTTEEKSISSVVREAERYAESIEEAESYKKKPSKNYKNGKNKNNYRDNRNGNYHSQKNSKSKQEGETDEPKQKRLVMLPESEINYTVEAAEGNPAAEFVSNLIAHMGIEGTVLAACDSDAIRLRIDSGAMGVLIGHRGETLDSIQYLTSLVVNRNRKEEGYTRITINTEAYREKREETLTKLAKRVAQQVRNTGRARVLEPMNPYERRILHAALQDNPFVATHSEGEEPNRRVVVTPKRRNRGYNNNRRRYDNRRSLGSRGQRNDTKTVDNAESEANPNVNSVTE